MNRVKIINKLFLGVLCIGLLWSLGAEARVMGFQLDNTGRDFHPGDFILVGMDGAIVREVRLDTRGYRGATVKLYADGVHMKTANYYDKSREWIKLPLKSPRRVNTLALNFGNIDPRVYAVEIVYDHDVEVRVEKEYITEYEYITKYVEIEVEVEVPVPSNDIYHLGIEIRDYFGQMKNTFGPHHPSINQFFYEIDQSLWNIETAGHIPGNTDAFVFFSQYAQNFLADFGCTRARRVYHAFGWFNGPSRVSVHGATAGIFKLIRAMHWPADQECSDKTNELLDTYVIPWLQERGASIDIDNDYS